MDRVPKNSIAHPEILMDHEIPHTANLIPWNRRVVKADFIGQMSGCFPDDDKIADHRVHGLSIGGEVWKVIPAV